MSDPVKDERDAELEQALHFAGRYETLGQHMPLPPGVRETVVLAAALRASREREERLREENERLKSPDYYYDPNCWEITYEWPDRADVRDWLTDADTGVVEVATLVKGPTLFAAMVGEDRETLEFFESEQLARAALKDNAR